MFFCFLLILGKMTLLLQLLQITSPLALSGPLCPVGNQSNQGHTNVWWLFFRIIPTVTTAGDWTLPGKPVADSFLHDTWMCDVFNVYLFVLKLVVFLPYSCHPLLKEGLKHHGKRAWQKGVVEQQAWRRRNEARSETNTHFLHSCICKQMLKGG